LPDICTRASSEAVVNQSPIIDVGNSLHGFKFGPLMGQALARAALGEQDPGRLAAWVTGEAEGRTAGSSSRCQSSCHPPGRAIQVSGECFSGRLTDQDYSIPD
jgi:hypothetical protein